MRQVGCENKTGVYNYKTMKNLTSLAALSALSLLLGCNRSDTDRASTESRETSSRIERQDTNNLTPTSRNPDAASRTYGTDTNTAAAKQPDNTGVNKRDRDDNTLTPGDQGTSEADREITRNIRRAIEKNDQLSTTAKNIKIITVNGKVTLRGPVNSEQEQQAITAAAQSVAGVGSFDNQLEVKAK